MFMLDLLVALATLPLVAMSGTSCADPAITMAVASPVAGNADLNTYDVAVTVKNLGGKAQPATLLQSVEFYQNATKVDQKGLQPLKPGGSQTVHYRMQRSSEARPGTTRVRVQLTMHDGHGAPVSNCLTSNDEKHITL
jgi:hypothetical protein